MNPPRQAHEEWLRLKLEELDAVERKIEATRPRNRIRWRLALMFLFPVVIGGAVVVSVEPSLMASSLFGLLVFVALTIVVAIVGPRHRLAALEWRRDEVLREVGP